MVFHLVLWFEMWSLVLLELYKLKFLRKYLDLRGMSYMMRNLLILISPPVLLA